MTSQPAYGLTHAYLVNGQAYDTLAKALRACAELGQLEISYVSWDWSVTR